MFARPNIAEKPARIDWVMMCALLGLMVLGVLFIYSARLVTDSDLPWFRHLHFKQIIFYVLGLAAMAGVCVIPYQTLARWSYVFYWASILLLLLVLIPHVGAMRFGARRWIDLGFFQLQPSEIAKIAFILALGNFLARPLDELRLTGNFWKALGMLGLPFAFILVEPDLGSALVLIPTGFVMMYVAGIPARYLRRFLGGSAIVVLLLLVDVLFAPPGWQLKLQDYQRRRLLVYFDMDAKYFAPPNATAAELQKAQIQKRNDEYNIIQALISVGSGGLTGKGWRQGTQNVLGYLPRAVAHNDFIFSVLAEESGFVGSVVVLSLYAVVLFAGIRIAGQARDRLGKMMAAGVVALLFSHMFINIGMNIRLMPVTGVPLPLLSYGGTSVICTLVAAGLLQNIYLHRRSY
ncbi:MAG: rod shape-determining protein RodA [Verrucomicrobia bacterium]|nr:rod shape-determining protein RodA [Verrucomicrobiota bacterium]